MEGKGMEGSNTKSCQQELHLWGVPKQVSFDPAKESMHVLSLRGVTGAKFRALRVIFVGALSMTSSIGEVITDAG